jgi:pilus assembly protein Flp/PilA
MFKRFLKDCSGASAAEYGLIIAVIGVGIGAAAIALGGNVAFAVNDDANKIYALNSAP